MRNKSTSAFIDSIEFGMCRLLLGDESFPITIPAKFIPDGLSEGEQVNIIFVSAPEAKKEKRDEVEDLLRGFEES